MMYKKKSAILSNKSDTPVIKTCNENIFPCALNIYTIAGRAFSIRQ